MVIEAGRDDLSSLDEHGAKVETHSRLGGDIRALLQVVLHERRQSTKAP